MLHGKLRERFSIILNNAISIRGHPKISLPILYDISEVVEWPHQKMLEKLAIVFI